MPKHRACASAPCAPVKVGGFKYARLYAPSQTPCLYPRPSAPHTSRVAPLEHQTAEEAAALASAFPRLMEVEGQEVLLAPGDTLFIPKGWWHYVRSLTTSVSVNFWF